ncbi:MAG: LacI family DNA-binding transcriptional regulator [Paludibacterium sp.]|uniref:LacI family DNA-binding transcriptional regulator n=1 Tax=Paludibacterium sp. TaxID=1917523 RepID=UPI0025EEB36F|nr:LacI family DNA-binding transcriptional regulator [Paludibacterium sp.]MBV8048475.1 LacI family DNA-binding transcriptional regulator [Paludibacterium sp.]MBV8646112.1 LacI family DNA-binding transcriptional regulator [Paludibacterium sp.]
MSVKIKDVAELAGVSVATVSRVLSNGSVSAALKTRVEEAVAQLGYRPNLSARRLRSQLSQTVGLIVSDVRNPFFTAVSRAVEDAAYRAGMRVILCNADEDPDKEAMYLRLMQEERVSGVIFSPTSVTAGRFRPERFEFPVVMIDREGPPGLTDAVVLDNPQAGRLLVEHLIARGYRKIGGLFGNVSTTGAARRAGYEAALAQHGLPSSVRFVAPSTEAASTAVRAWLAEPDWPDALVVSNGLLLLGAVHALTEAGLSIPGDMALAGFDNDVWTGLVGHGLTVIEQPVYDIGVVAMEMLLSRLENPSLAKRKVVLNGALLERASTSGRGAAAPS